MVGHESETPLVPGREVVGEVTGSRLPISKSDGVLGSGWRSVLAKCVR